jgi:hypothetical protein
MLAATGSCSTGVVPGSSEFKNTAAVVVLQSGLKLVHVLGIAIAAKSSSFEPSAGNDLVIDDEEEFVGAGVYVRKNESTGSECTIVDVHASVEEEGEGYWIGLD